MTKISLNQLKIRTKLMTQKINSKQDLGKEYKRKL